MRHELMNGIPTTARAVIRLSHMRDGDYNEEVTS